MKKCKIKMTDQERNYLLGLLRLHDLANVARLAPDQNGFFWLLLLYTPLEKLMGQLYKGQRTIALDVSTAAALYTVFSSMSISNYSPVLSVAQTVEKYITTILYTTQKV